MISLPLPVFVGLLLGFILVRGIATGVARPLLVLLGLCAVQAALASFNLLYDAPAIRSLQITTASLIAAMAWVAYVTTTRRAFQFMPDGLHLIAGPLGATFIGIVDVKVLDGFLTLWFAAHGIAMLMSILRGTDALPQVPLESVESARKLWIGSALALLATGIVDFVIIICVVAGFVEWVPWIVTSSSAAVLLCLAVLGLAQPQSGRPEVRQIPDLPQAIDEEAIVLFARAEVLLKEQKLYLDPDLNLTRLARRLHVPVKKLSAAINQSTGESVSRLINGYRIKTVCDALVDDDVSVTQAMFAAGFSTKSNFNTEFRRVTGKAPREWLATAASDAALPR